MTTALKTVTASLFWEHIKKGISMAARRGKAFLFLLVLLNGIIFLAVPWDKLFYDTEKAINGYPGMLTEVDAEYLEPTGVYVPMTFGEGAVKGYQHPGWFHRKMNPYAQFYIYSGPIPEGVYFDISNKREGYDGLPVLISEQIKVPATGKVKIDLSDAQFPRTYYVSEAMEKVGDKYDLPGRDYFDSATLLDKQLMEFKKASNRVFIFVVLAEAVLFTIVLVIVGTVTLAKSKKGGGPGGDGGPGGVGQGGPGGVGQGGPGGPYPVQ